MFYQTAEVKYFMVEIGLWHIWCDLGANIPMKLDHDSKGSYTFDYNKQWLFICMEYVIIPTCAYPTWEEACIVVVVSPYYGVEGVSIPQLSVLVNLSVYS